MARIRQKVPPMEKDRFLAPELKATEKLVRTGELVRSAGAAINPLE